MFKLLKKALQVGEATVEYPFKPLKVSPGFRGKPVYKLLAVCSLRRVRERLSRQCHYDGL